MTIGAPARQLPLQPNALVGREADLASLREVLLERRARLVTLIGAGGSGKTRLALAVAEAVQSDYADGAWFVDLTAVPAGESDLVWLAVAERLGLGQSASETPNQVLREALADRSLLLVLDNFEHVIGAGDELSRLLESAPGFQVMATSREPIRLRWEHTYPVPPLETDVAVKLFAERARAVEPRFALDDEIAATVAELCGRLDGLPLAIELAAARSRVLGPHALLMRLGGRPDLLSSAARDAPPRHRTLAATIAWSYALLEDGDRAVFRHLGLFAGACTAAAAAAVCAPVLENPSAIDALDQLTLLADKSLLRVEPGPDGEPRFRMLETLREFALEQLRSNGEEAGAAGRQAAFYRGLSEQAERAIPGPDEVLWLDRLEAEYPNLRNVVRWAATSGAHDVVVDMCVRLAVFWRFRGHMREALDWVEEALRQANESMSRSLRARGLELAGRFAWATGQREQGREYVGEALAMLRHLGDTAGLAQALSEWGLQAGDSGHPSVARAALEESLAMFRSLGDVNGTTHALHALGFRAEERGELAQAESLLIESLNLRRSIGHPSGLARTLNGLGIVARGQRKLERAEALHEESLALYRGLGHTLGVAYALVYQARVALARGNDRRAAALAAESLLIAHDLRNPWVMSLGVGTFGLLAARHRVGENGARLLGASERLLGGVPPASSTERAEHDRAMASVRALLGDGFDAAWAAGAAIPNADVVREALAVRDMVDLMPERTSPEPATEPLPLSARELEVARLVARGLTNRQIAEELIISKWTADNHVANILRKLDLVGRAQVAAWLAERKLLP